MTASVTIGEFSRLTHLSVKTLHHYHEIGLLAPAKIDPSSGYRRYETCQVPVAQLIRRLRDLQMPLSQVRSVIEAPDVATRDRALRAHLDQMERELVRTQEVVASLRGMLTLPIEQLPVEYRYQPAFRAYAVSERVDRSEIFDWCNATFTRLGQLAIAEGLTAPAGATYDDEFFTEGIGEVVAYVPLPPDHDGSERTGGVELIELPAGYYAVSVHTGPLADFDRSYGALGSHVAEYCEVAPGPIHEIYVVSPGETDDPAEFRTEICWPIQRFPTPKG